MKNFSDLLKQDQQTVANPYVYSTPQVQQQIIKGIDNKVVTLMIGSTLGHIITAPLQTVVSSMQLSVLPHKDIFVSVQSRTKQLAKLNTQLTIAQKRNLQLMIRTGGEFQPYTAPVYTEYQQAFRNLSKQGWKAFFKGLTFRICHQIPHLLCYGQIVRNFTQNQHKKDFSLSQMILKSWGIMALIDMSFNMFHILQNRYVLQNNIKQFRVFRNVFRVFGKMLTRGQLFKGVYFHATNSLIEVMLRSPMYLSLFLTSKIKEIPIGLYYLSQALVYPINTAYKRLVCQTTAIPGMIPIRYSGIGHALKVIAFEQKIWGLYRGFGLYHVNMLTKLLVLQFVFKHVVVQSQTDF